MSGFTKDQEDAFLNITSLASQICDTPTAMINFIDNDYQWTRFNIGWKNVKIPKKDSICQFTVEQEQLLYIPDTSADKRLQKIQAVQNSPDIGFYAGISVKGSLGDKLATLCVIDHKPRKLTKKQKKALETLADEVRARLELMRINNNLEEKNDALLKKSRFLDNSADIMLILHPDTLVIEEVHADIKNNLGYRPHDLKNARFTDFCTHSDLSQTLTTWINQYKTGKFDFEAGFKSKSNGIILFQFNISKADSRLYLTGRDISERHHALQQLKKQRKFSEGIIQNLPGIFCLTKPDGTIIKWNRNLEQITGLHREEISGSNVSILVSDDDMPLIVNKLKEVFENDYARSEFSLAAKDGKKTPYLMTGFRHDVNEDTYAVLIGVNISRETETLNALSEKEKNLQRTVNRLKEAHHIAKLGSWEWDVSNNTLYWSDETYKMLNFDKSSYQPSVEKFLKLLHTDDQEKLNKILQLALEEKQFQEIEHDIRLPDGKIKHVYERGEVIIDDENKPVKIIGTIQDITDQKMAELQLNETLNEREILLAEIHHRVKNNLAVISGLLELEFMKLGDNASSQLLTNIVMRIKSIALIHDKLYESRDFKNIPMDSYVDDLLSFVQNKFQIGNEIMVKKDIDDVRLNVNIAVPFGLILNELVINAFKHAYPKGLGGVIDIKIKRLNDEVCLSISDNGVGLPDDFDLGNQHTIGFTLVNVLSSQLQAKYSITSDPGANFTFKFKIPADKKGSGAHLNPDRLN